MFEPYFFKGQNIGFSASADNIFFFFGNRHFRKDDFASVFPDFKFLLLRQVHGDQVVVASSATETADAHFTSERNAALVVQTADCLPILFAGPKSIAACHAGWRGVANGIISRTFACIPEAERIVIGPHIQRPSFEVGFDVAQQILASLPNTERSRLLTSHPDPGKCYVDLARTAELQLQRARPAAPVIQHLGIDTQTDLNFHSYRRDGARAERQYSFIVRIT